MLCKLVNQATSPLTNLQRRTEKARNVINDIIRSAGEEVCDILGMVMGFCGNNDVGHVEAGSTARAGTG